MFLVPWLTLLISAAGLIIETRHVIPHGIIPMLFILAMLPLVGFCLIAAAVAGRRAEGWRIAVNVVCNSSYGLVWYFAGRIPVAHSDLKSPAAVWNPTVLDGPWQRNWIDRAHRWADVFSSIQKARFRLAEVARNLHRKEMPCDTCVCLP